MVMPTPTRASGPRQSVCRDVNALRERRMRAVELFEAGMRQVDVVTQLGVSAQAASRWYHSWRTGGRDALVGAERLGRTARLSEQQLAEVQAAATPGPPSQRTRRCGHRGVGQEGLAEDQKGARRAGAWICFQDESGFSLLPVVRGTWAPRGQTPVLTHRFSWSRMSMAGVLAYRPDRSRAKLIFQTKPGSYNTESLIAYLTDLRRHLRGKPVILIWDGLSAHRSKDMKAWLATQRHRLRVEALPGYAHDLNPMELVWGNLKATELANLCPEALDEADTAAHTGLRRIGASYRLCFNFLAHTGLRL